MTSRRNFIKNSVLAGAAFAGGSSALTAGSYRRIIGANDRVNAGVVGFSDRFVSSLFPSFNAHRAALNFDMVAVSDIWSVRRSEGAAFLKKELGREVAQCVNNEALYARKDVDVVIVSTADFQHALHCIEAVEAGRDAYVEKPFAESMADARAALQAVKKSGRIVQIGSQRRSGPNYVAAADYIKAGKFGPLVKVELTWNVNQPGRWRRPALVARLNEKDTDWKRWILNRPYEPFNARKYCEYRLFWPYSSGLPGQWMSHQIDTVHWFTGLQHPRSVVANGGIYAWKDGRTNWDTLTAVFDYGPQNDAGSGFQVTYSARQANGDENPGEVYFSNGGELNLITNKVSAAGGLTRQHAEAMKMQPNLLQPFDLANTEKVAAAANTGGDWLTSLHMKNFMECVRSRKQPNAPVEAGYAHSIANIMTTAASRTGFKATFDEARQEVMVNGSVFTY